jgi:hypothetical protein
MAPEAEIEEPARRGGALRIGCAASLAFAVLLLAAFAILWINRKDIADNVIARELESRGIPASYEIETIAGRHQVLRNIVVGDPAKPDLTVERAEVIMRYGFGLPSIAEVRLTRPRLYGTYRGGKLSFGALDPLVFTGSKEPFALPDMRLRVSDGRALLESDYGPIGIGLTGGGPLQGGFVGELAATAPRLVLGGCELRGATLYGQVAVKSERPGFEGPLRLDALTCPDQALKLESTALQVAAKADKTLTVFEGTAGLRAGAAGLGANRLASLGGKSEFIWREGGLTARYDLAGAGLDTGAARVARVGIDGSLRTRRDFAWIELDTRLAGQGVRLGEAVDAALASAETSVRDTLLGPLLARARGALAAESRTSTFSAEATLRRADGTMALDMPQATLRAAGGASLLAVSRVRGVLEEGKAPRFSGNFASGGPNLPRLIGRLEQSPDGVMQAHLSMAEYAVGEARLAIPELALARDADGELGFFGQARASGALPGGFADNLALPLSGNWSAARGLALWRDCTELRFDALRFASLTLERRGVTLCPARGSAIVRYGAEGLRVAAGAPSLELSGKLGETPIAIRSGPVGLAWPGALSARQLQITLGPPETATRFALQDLSAQLGEGIAGRFDGADARLYAVPLDLLGAHGAWRYADGRLTLSDGAFRLEDRQSPARFEPLTAEGATLTLEDNRIGAHAALREALTGREVTEVDIAHDLASGRGHADLTVGNLTFDSVLQPETLTRLAYGMVANVRGTVTGAGRIDWDESGVTSSGRFSSDSLDLAAAFGPVKGASGTVEFTDLLGLTTAPGQRLHVASVNPGIEVLDGDVTFQLRGGEVLEVEGGTWPFMGGTLTMHPVDITFGAAEERRYVFEIEGLDAARFIERMELGNISATGIFDGTVPVVFDAQGNGRLEGGLLLSRPPGGNVSYVGELTYEDLGTMANLTFDALRSLDYRQMRVEMNGDLAGEVITSVRIDGVSQGAGAKRNILTRAIAGLPIRLDLNVRAQFYALLGNLRSLYDPAAVKDPRSPDVGLLDEQGNPIARDADGNPLPPAPATPTPDENLIQRRESEENR